MVKRAIAIEDEKKYKVDGVSKENIAKVGKPMKIQQFYLDLDNNLVRDLIIQCYGVPALKVAEEARVRVINGGEKIVFNIKSGGTNGRAEGQDIDLDADYAGMLTAVAGVSSIKKDRYRYRRGFGIVEIDVYQDRDLVIAEFEYDKDVLSSGDVDEIVKEAIRSIDSNASIRDVTNEKGYKNKNLAVLIQSGSESV